jgi:integrase
MTRKPTQRMRLSEAVVAKLAVPERGRPIVYDQSLPGFGVRLTPNGSRSYVVHRRVGGKARIILLGHFPGVSVEVARQEARKRMGEIAGGIDPNQEKREGAIRGRSLGTLFEDFSKARKSKLRARTLAEYKRIVENQFREWIHLPYVDITPEMVEARFDRLSRNSGPAAANLAMRVLRALLNYGDVDANPVKRLSRAKRWHRIDRRQTIIKPDDLKAWWQAVEALADGNGGDVLRDYLETLVLTGLRKNEAATLRVQNVDLKAQTLAIPDPKNRQPHRLPMGRALTIIMDRRVRSAPGLWVFPSADGGHIADARKAIARVYNASAVKFIPHDLRRTFATVAEGLDVGGYTLKRLLNHKVSSSDVTAGYIVPDVERLRRPMQQIEDRMLDLAGVTPAVPAVPVKPRNARKAKPKVRP